jgi:ABC-type Na+ efflux pump permease subunit
MDETQDEVEEVENGQETGEIQEGERETLTISIDGEEPEERQEAPDWVKQLRKDRQEDKKLLQEREREIAELRAKLAPKVVKKPSLAEFDYDAEKFERAYENWQQAQLAEKNKAAAVENAQKQQQEAYQAKLSAHQERAAKLPVDDYSEAEATVLGSLSPEQQGMLISAAKKSEILVYGLFQHPQKLAYLASLNDPLDFVAETARMEMSMKPTQSKPAPEPRVAGSTASITNIGDKRLQELEEEAARTGDRTKVQRYKREQKRKAS